jgi:hypothetical protein
VRAIAFKQIRTSDLTGEVIDDTDIVTVVVKGHPALAGDSKVFDTTEKELEALKTVTGLVELELRLPGGTRTVMATAAELAKVIPDDTLKGFDSARGRRTGYKPVGNGNH